jgi:hypothetical protein
MGEVTGGVMFSRAFACINERIFLGSALKGIQEGMMMIKWGVACRHHISLLYQIGKW